MTMPPTDGSQLRPRDDTARALAAEVEQLSCAALVDAMGRLHGHRAHLLPMTSPDPERTLFGPAVTISYMPARDDLAQSELGFASLFYAAIADEPAGKVLVLSSGGYPDVSLGGGTKLSRLDHHGLAGVLADGRLRDFSQLRANRFSTWCRDETTRWGGDAVMPFAANVAVAVGGVCVTPGDHIYADASGAVVIPAASLRRVLDEAHQIEADDTRDLAQIASEVLAGDGPRPASPPPLG